MLPTGEVRPGVRTPRVLAASERRTTSAFGTLDFVVIGAYFAALIAMGLWLSRRERSTEDFFLGGRRVPWWAAGISIFGTQLSAITYMAIPAKSFATNWAYFLGNMMIATGTAPIIVFVYLPFFRRQKLVSAYEFLERRFDLKTRLTGSAAFLFFQLGRMGIVLYLPALALSAVTGVDVNVAILAMGVLATLYTVLGGIEAVIWTDVVQVVVLIGGALLALVVIAGGVDGGLGGVVADASAADKLRLYDPGWSAATTTLWVVVVGNVFYNVVSYSSDQTVVQRYLTTRTEREAARSIWTNALLSVPVSCLFFFLGTALWAFYRARPERLDPVGRTDDVLPWFVAHEMPAGVSGLVIAGLFAAAMSSLDSSMNSMATAITTDFYGRAKPGASDARRLRLARVLTVALGVVGTGSAVWMAAYGGKSMLDQYLAVVGLFLGGLGGLFLLGIATRRASGTAALIGFAGSAAVLAWVQGSGRVHFMLYSGLGAVSCFAIGWVAGLGAPAARGREPLEWVHALAGRIRSPRPHAAHARAGSGGGAGSAAGRLPLHRPQERRRRRLGALPAQGDRRDATRVGGRALRRPRAPGRLRACRRTRERPRGRAGRRRCRALRAEGRPRARRRRARRRRHGARRREGERRGARPRRHDR